MRKTTASVRGVLILLLLLIPALTVADPAAAGGRERARTISFHMTGELTFLDVASGFPMVVIDKGIASRLGLFFNVGKYPTPGAGFGIYCLATGEKLYWRQGSGNLIEFTGGTGRFKKASGSFTFTMSDAEYVPGPEGTTSYVARYTGQGTLTY